MRRLLLATALLSGCASFDEAESAFVMRDAKVADVFDSVADRVESGNLAVGKDVTTAINTKLETVDDGTMDDVRASLGAIRESRELARYLRYVASARRRTSTASSRQIDGFQVLIGFVVGIVFAGVAMRSKPKGAAK